MKSFFSCDWGTSNFRLRLIDVEDLSVQAEIKTPYGIAAAFDGWKQANKQEQNRMAFYQDYLFEQVKKIPVPSNHSVSNAPIILSGMASSSIGMMELPYKELRFRSDGSDLILHTVKENELNPHKLMIISGVRSDVDVMRGEETMLAGCHVPANEQQHLFIFPGTHSKHIMVRNGLAESFTTFMTGELFHLLSAQSILASSVEENNSDSGDHFLAGVQQGASSNIMNSIFHVRTNALFGKATAKENYHYLSGLLIGHELKSVALKIPDAITLVCSEGMKTAYMQALSILGVKHGQFSQADEALVKGQRRIAYNKDV